MEEEHKPNTLEDNSYCFKSLSTDELEFLSLNKTQITYLKGETVFKQGAFAPHVLFVHSGLVRVYLQTNPNKQVNIRLAKQGDFIAFSSIFDVNIYQYSGSALKESVVCMLDKEALKQVLLRNPEFALRITSRNCKLESRYLDIINNVTYKQMRGKLASAILYLASDDFKDENVFQYLTRQDIADFASITIESAIKFLKEFESEAIISLDGKNIEVQDQKRLVDISTKG
ncbi:MAG: Crp/Fnr family transcriptional regulator [Bacteroidales bacterium]|nr:Crp/Fnr family transcriptional regulator [Bacteroidales bacterium]